MKLMHNLLPGIDETADVEGHAMMQRLVPPFMFCMDLEGLTPVQVILHTRFPRFIGVITTMDANGRESFKAEGFPTPSIPGTDDATLLPLWIDWPPKNRDISPLLEEAVRLADQYLNRRAS
jgi:hypothetical protein